MASPGRQGTLPGLLGGSQDSDGQGGCSFTDDGTSLLRTRVRSVPGRLRSHWLGCREDPDLPPEDALSPWTCPWEPSAQPRSPRWPQGHGLVVSSHGGCPRGHVALETRTRWTEPAWAAVAWFRGDLAISPCNLVNFFSYKPCFSGNKEDYQS